MSEFNPYIEEIDEAEQKIIMERIARETLRAAQTDGKATARYLGNNPNLGEVYSVDNDENLYMFNLRELKTAAKEEQILLTVTL